MLLLPLALLTVTVSDADLHARAFVIGVDAQFFSIWVDPRNVAKEQSWVEAMRAMVQENPSAIALAGTAAELRVLEANER